MSSSVDCSEIASGRRFSRKPSFSLTCTRLSQYLKENGSFGDLSLGMSCKPEINNGISRQPTTTMSLFPCEASSNLESMAAQDVKPESLFHRQPSLSSSSSSHPKEDVLKLTQTSSTRSVKPESQTTSPLTIFYAGKVIVFNEFSSEKAEEIMNLASKGAAISLTKMYPFFVLFQKELPIARRASLHRFLAKRKDRVTSKAPYQLCDPAKAQTGDNNNNNNTSWLGFSR
ncbi:unnamed protein product [Cochlearia groenlandica]